jgi:hypothetical protein
MNGSLRRALVSIGVAASSLTLVTMASAARATTVTAVKVTGSSSRPVFTVTGHGLALPKPNPTTSPSGQPLCPLQITGNVGLDYGNALFVIVWDGQSQDPNAQLYAAGRYRPKLSELDCIGIVVLKSTPTRLTFTLGHAYQQYYGVKPRFIRSGDVVEIGVGAARFATVVHF